MEIEVCVEKIETAFAANKFGANRIELCSALDLGGLTPSIGIIEECSEKCSLDVYTMIRPRGGRFNYTPAELNIMLKDIRAAKSVGADGVVFGCLNDDLTLNKYQNQLLIETAKSLDLGVTFHRAFDFIINPEESLDFLIDIGVDRILTSGQKPTAIEGIEKIKHFVNKSNSQIQIMAGSGVNFSNIKALIQTGINAIHFTTRKEIRQDDSLNMGKEYEPDTKKITTIVELLNN